MLKYFPRDRWSTLVPEKSLRNVSDNMDAYQSDSGVKSLNDVWLQGG